MKKIFKKVLPIVNILLMAGVPTAVVVAASVLTSCDNPSGGAKKDEVVNHNITAAQVDGQSLVRGEVGMSSYHNVDSIIFAVLNADANDTVTLPAGKGIAISYQYLNNPRVILNKADVRGVLNSVKNVLEIDAEGYTGIQWAVTDGGVPGVALLNPSQYKQEFHLANAKAKTLPRHV